MVAGNIYLFMNPDIFMSENMDALPEASGGYLSDRRIPGGDGTGLPAPGWSTNWLHLNLKEILSLPQTEATRGQNIYQFCPSAFS